MNHSNTEMRIFENKMDTLLGNIKELNVSEYKSSLMFEKNQFYKNDHCPQTDLLIQGNPK